MRICIFSISIHQKQTANTTGIKLPDVSFIIENQVQHKTIDGKKTATVILLKMNVND